MFSIPQKLNYIHNSPVSSSQHRRMSDPPSALYPPPVHCRYSNNLNSSAFAYNPAPRPLYSTHLHRGASTGSLRDVRHHHVHCSPTLHPTEWKQTIDPRPYFDPYDEPISPLQPNFSGGLSGSPNSGMPYSPISENPYGPSPPGTGTSTSSSVAPFSNGSAIPCSPSLSISQHLQRSISTPNMAADVVDTKTYAFVALPGNTVKKRPRRRYDEIERLYQCSWPECTKAYGTLNHLNAHVTMQKHGPKRTPDEFKEMRKQWRKAKKVQSAAANIRRDSFGDNYDDSTGYDHQYGGQHASHLVHPISRSHSFQDDLGLPTSVSIAGERYSVPIEDIRYPPSNEREEDSEGMGGGYSNGILNRPRYSNGLPSSWHGNSVLSRSPNSGNLQHQHQHHEHYEPASVPPHTHHSHLPHLAIGGGVTRPMSPPPHSAPVHYHNHSAMSVNRVGGGLPESGALLTTPLSGYHHDSSSLISPIQNGSALANVIYASERYDLYDTDSTGRPGTGHTNASGS